MIAILTLGLMSLLGLKTTLASQTNKKRLSPGTYPAHHCVMLYIAHRYHLLFSNISWRNTNNIPASDAIEAPAELEDRDSLSDSEMSDVSQASTVICSIDAASLY